jgi:16S rRNA (cytosine1407-C5)-methyltransferase
MHEEFLHRTSLAWGVCVPEVAALLSTRYETTVRINPLKVRKSTLIAIKNNFAEIEPITWVENAYHVWDGKLPASQLPEFINGEIILQNAASFIPVLELHPNQGEVILDMCAAPGGKASHIAALTANKALLTLNDTSRTRFFKMKKLMQTMGVSAEQSLRDGRLLSKTYGTNSFDKILLDVPCSGEANMGLNNITAWSLSTIKRLQNIQIKLLREAFIMLKPGGRLVYSTCTIAPEENELVIDNLLKHQPAADIIIPNIYPVDQKPGLKQWNDKVLDYRLQRTIRLLPSRACKPFYVAVITKTTHDEDDSLQRLKRYYL